MRRAIPATLLAVTALAGCATAPAPVAPVAATPAPAPASAPTPAKQYQWLHGSAEAAILSRQAYDGMVRYVAAALKQRPADGVVLAAGATPVDARWVTCGAKPSAVVLDMDETAILNTGANYDSAVRGDPPFDPARWSRWEAGGAQLVQPVPGAVEALAELRRLGVTVVFNSNRDRNFTQGAVDALKAAGLGDAVPGETLWLRGDVAPGSAKDPRRAAIAARYCVLAMAGDQLGDFSDAFNAKGLSVQARRDLGQAAAVRGKWGAGWFLIPNPLYGPGVAGSFDDIFPADKRWTPEEKN